MADELLVATKTFLTSVDGRRVRVVKDQTRVRAGHPLLEGREHLFKVADAHFDVEDATARPGQKRGGRRAAKSTRTAEKSPKSDDAAADED